MHVSVRMQTCFLMSLPAGSDRRRRVSPPDQQGAREYRADQRVGLRLVAAANLAPTIDETGYKSVPLKHSKDHFNDGTDS